MVYLTLEKNGTQWSAYLRQGPTVYLFNPEVQPQQLVTLLVPY